MRRDNMTIIPQPFLSTVFLSGQYPPVARWKRLRNNDGTFLDVGQHDINLGSQSESPTGTTYPDLTAVSSVTLRFLRFMRR